MGALSVINGIGAVPSSGGQVTDAAIPSAIARDAELPTNVSELTNDAGYVTSSGVTSVATGSGLTGGTITDTGTLSHADTSTLTGAQSATDQFVNSITVDEFGHVTAVGTAAAGGGDVALPSNNGIGTFALMRNESNQSTWNNGQEVSGTGIRLTGLDSSGTSLYGTTVSGTWRNTGASLQGSRQTTTGLRVS